MQTYLTITDDDTEYVCGPEDGGDATALAIGLVVMDAMRRTGESLVAFECERLVMDSEAVAGLPEVE